MLEQPATVRNLAQLRDDGFTVLESSASRELSGLVSFLRQYGTILLLLVFFKGSVLFRPIFSLVARLMYSLEGLLL